MDIKRFVLSFCILASFCGCAATVEKVGPSDFDVIDEVNCKNNPSEEIKSQLKAIGFSRQEICNGVSLKDAVWKLHERVLRIENAD